MPGKSRCPIAIASLAIQAVPHWVLTGPPPLSRTLLSQVLVGKYLDHLPLYKQEAIFGRAGLAIPRSTLASWV